MDPKPSQYVQLLENWIPGIGECTELHDNLHRHFSLGFSVNCEARLLGFQCGHHPASNIFHVVIFCLISATIYPADYRNQWIDLIDFYRAYLLGKDWQMVSYWFCPRSLLQWGKSSDLKVRGAEPAAALELLESSS